MASILDGIDGVSIANQIRLERAVHNGSFLLVEGSRDASIFDRFRSQEKCSIVVCLGKGKMVKAINELDAEGFAGVLGFMDRDLSEFLGYPDVRGDVVYSDENDMEVSIICSEALDRVLVEFGNEAAVKETVRTRGISVREIIFSSASVVGALRLVAQEHGVPLRFEGMKYKFEKRNSCVIDEILTIRHVFGRSKKRGDKKEGDLQIAVRAYLSELLDSKSLCSGHDCVRVLGRALKNEFGSSNQFISDEGALTLEGILRVSYDWRDFQSTRAYNSMRSWEEERGFTIFGSDV